MNHPITTATIGLLVVFATACADTSSAEPINTSPVSEPSTPAPEPPETAAPPATDIPPEPTEPEPTEPEPTEPPSPTTVAPSPTTIPPPTPTIPPPPPPTTVPPPAPTVPAPTLPPAEPNAAECLIGDWIVTDTDLHTYFDVVAGNASFQAIDSTGVIRLTVTDTAFTWTNDYSLTMTFDDDTVYESTSSGAFHGAYSATDGVISGMVLWDNRTGTVTQDGEPVGDVGDLFVGINPARPMDAAAFSCDGPTLMVDAGPLAGARHALPLVPA